MFTSRLPVSTSVRRPSANDGSTSFVGLNRASNIPVSVRKANLFTPQTNRRPFMSGASTAGKSYASGTMSDRKQPRSLKPNPDRDEQLRMFENLVNFLRNNATHIPPPEAKKFFASVSTSESTRIFECLISRILPSFKFTKLETSVPEALTLLEYPYIRSVTRSALVSVTTRSAAVGLLIIFDWLIYIINGLDNPNDDKFDELEDLQDPQAVLSEMYRNVILFRDNAKDKHQETINKLYPPRDIQSIEEEIIQVTEECNRIQQSLEENNELEQEIALLREDCAKWEDYYNRMETYMQSKNESESELQQSLAKLKIFTEESVKRDEILNSNINNHEFTESDVDRLAAEKDRLASDVSLLSTKFKESELENERLENYDRELQNELKRRRATEVANLNVLLDRYNEFYVHFESKLLAERKSDIQTWICRLEQTPCDDIAQNIKLKRELGFFRDKLRATHPTLESEIVDNALVLESECDQLRKVVEGHPKKIQKLKEIFQAKDKELVYIESMKQSNVSKLSERQTREDQLRLELKVAHNHEVARNSKEITLIQNQNQYILTEIAETNNLNEKHRLALQKQVHTELSALSQDLKKNTDAWKEARMITQKNNEIVKRALKRYRKSRNK